MTLAGVRQHQADLQAIADANGGTRVSGSPGYDESVDYVVEKATAAGWQVSTQAFDFQTFVSLSPSVLEQVSPAPAGPLAHNIMSYSGSGDVTASVSTPSGDFRGCTAADWAGFPAGNIALVSRGTPDGQPSCTFAIKALTAMAAGAAEESNLVGSTYYVNNLPLTERQKVALYLNFDMVGSPNYVFQIYDGDDSDGVGAPAGPPGSAQIEKTFEAFYTARDEPFKGTDFTGRSDYGPFIAVNVPAGGLFTGAEVIKTAEEAAIWGGTAGAQYDPC